MTRPETGLSPRLISLYLFVCVFLKKTGTLPTIRQIVASGVHSTSTSTVNYDLRKLAKLGYLEDRGKNSGARIRYWPTGAEITFPARYFSFAKYHNNLLSEVEKVIREMVGDYDITVRG